MPAAARHWWLRLHRWLGLGAGLALALVALAGAALLVLKPIDQRLSRGLFAGSTPAAGAMSLEAIRQAAVQRYGPESRLTLRPPRAAGETFWVRVSGAWDGTAYFDPGSARFLGQRGELEGVVNFLFELHSALLLGERGKPVLAFIALSCAFLLASGAVLWWPQQWRNAWRVRLDAGATRSLFDLHRAGGSLLGVVILVTVTSGAYMAWKPLSRFVTAVAGDVPFKVPTLAAPSGRPASLDAMADTARILFPQGKIGYIQLPGAAFKPVRMRMKLPDDPHPNGLTSVWFHPATGAVLSVQRWDQLDAGAKANSYLYPLHTGELGGLPHQVLNAVCGVALFGLAVTGVCLWWRRRQARARAVPRLSRTTS